jgi:hypothetical protein
MSRIGDSLVLSAIPDSQGLLPAMVIFGVSAFILDFRWQL